MNDGQGEERNLNLVGTQIQPVTAQNMTTPSQLIIKLKGLRNYPATRRHHTLKSEDLNRYTNGSVRRATTRQTTMI